MSNRSTMTQVTHAPRRRHRRLFALPAVYPYQAAPMETLLADIAYIAGRVASVRISQESFPVLRRPIREAVRVAGVVLAVAESLILSGGEVCTTAGVALSELHVAMQKVRFLVADCGRKGCRLWLLMKMNSAIAELRLALSSVATAADVLLPRVAGLAPEAAEMISLLSSQARRLSGISSSDCDVSAAATTVDSLDAFKNRSPPCAAALRAALDHVGVRSWSSCSDEIDFLEDELIDGATDEDVPLLGSLVGLLLYSRVVLFDSVDCKKKHSPVPEKEVVLWMKPESFQCPISLETMTDPVTVTTGQTYDRPSIKRWLKSGCRPTCPVTGETLATTDLVPNIAILRLVEKYRIADGAHKKFTMETTAAPFSAAYAGAVELAAEFVVGKFAQGSPEEKKKASFELRRMTKHSVFNRGVFVGAGAVPWLLHLLSSPEPATQDNAVAGILNISKLDAGRDAIVDAGGLGLIVDAVNVGARAEFRQNAAAVLFYVAGAGDDYGKEIGGIPEAIPALVALMNSGAYRGRKNAVVSLYALMSYSGNRDKFVAAGGVPALAGVLLSERDDLVSDAIELLEKIAGERDAAAAMLENAVVVSKTVEVLSSSPSRSVKEHCASLLLSLCNHGGDRVTGALSASPRVIAELYGLIAGAGPPPAGKKARALLSKIHRYGELEGHVAAAAAYVGGERVIHAV